MERFHARLGPVADTTRITWRNDVYESYIVDELGDVPWDQLQRLPYSMFAGGELRQGEIFVRMTRTFDLRLVDGVWQR